MDAGSSDRSERGGNWLLGMGRQRRVEKENKFTLHTERCENIKNLYINKNKIIIIIIIPEKLAPEQNLIGVFTS